MAGRCFNDLFLAGIVFTVFVVWRVGFGVPAGWGSGSGRRGSGFRPAVGFRVRRFGVEMKPSLGTKNPNSDHEADDDDERRGEVPG